MRRSLLASASAGFPGWDVIKVFSVAAPDRSNVPRSLGQSDLGRLTAPQHWRGRGSTVTVSASEEAYKILKLSLAGAMLCQEISRILFPLDFPEIDSLAAHNLLDPQGVGVQVPHLAQPLA